MTDSFETQILQSLIGDDATVIEIGAGASRPTPSLASAAVRRGRVVGFDAATVTDTLDEWLVNDSGTIALIRVDAQSAEPRVLDGVRRILAHHPETWLATKFSPSALRKAGSSAAEYLERLHTLGGAIFRIDEQRARLMPFDERWLAGEATDERDRSITLLIVPSGWPRLHDWPITAPDRQSSSSIDAVADRTASAQRRPRVLLIAPAPANATPASHLFHDLRPIRDALAAHGVDADIAGTANVGDVDAVALATESVGAPVAPRVATPVTMDGYDVVHFFNTGDPAELARQLASIGSSGCPRVLSPLAPIAADAADSRGLVALADHLVVFSERELRDLHDANALDKPYSVVHHAVDSSWTASADVNAFTPASGDRVREYVLCAGMTAARAIQLEQSLAGTGIELVRLDDRPDASAYAAARMFVDANEGAAPPVAALRAAAAGLPLIVHESSCVREYLGPLASYCDTADDAVLRERLTSFWAAQDHEDASAAGERGGAGDARAARDAREARRQYARAWIERALTWDHAAREMAHAYAGVLDARAHSGRSDFARPAPRKIEIGSGMEPQPGYEHLDARADLPDIDYVADTREALPFPDGTFDELLARSCIEHVSWRDIHRVVREWGRIVKPGGIIEIWTPDFEYLCRRYLARKDDRRLDPALVAATGDSLGGYDESAWAIVKMFGGQEYPENFHGAVLDEEVLTRILEGAGFEQIARHEPYSGLHLIARRAPVFAHVAASGARSRPVRADDIAPALVWDAPIFNFGGYAALSRHTVRALVADGASVRIISRDEDPRMREASLTSREAWLWRRVLRRRGHAGVHVSCYTPANWQGASVFEQRRAEHPGFQAYVGLSMFETDRLPAHWSQACAALDEVWVPSRHARDLFAQAGVAPHKLRVLPVGIDADRYDPARVEPLPIAGRRGYMFLSVFDWTPRKGWDVLIEAYARAFRASDDVCLVLRTASRSPRERPGDAIDAVFNRVGVARHERPPVIVLDAPLSEEDMPRLYRAADAFVLPTRGEGWGLPLMEAMASGLPAIATGWGGHLDFMNAGNSWLIEVEGLEPVAAEQASRSPFYAGGHRWAQPSIAHTARLMRVAFDDRAQARRLGQAAREDIRTSWTPRRTAAWIADRVAHLAPDPAVLLEQAVAAEATGRIEEALNLYAEAGRHPAGHLARYNRASLLERHGRRDEAERLFRDVARHADTSLQAGALFHLGELVFLAGRIDEARDHFNACLARNPRHGAARAWHAFITGRLAEREGDLAAAERAYAEGCALKPDWPLAMYNLASVCRRLNQIDRARELFAEVAGKGSEPALRGGSHFHLAQLAEATGDVADAVAHLDVCKRELPAHRGADALRERLLSRR